MVNDLRAAMPVGAGKFIVAYGMLDSDFGVNAGLQVSTT